MRKFLPEFMDGALNLIQNGVMGKIAFFHPILDKNTLLQTTQMKNQCAKLLNWKEKNIKVLKTDGVSSPRDRQAHREAILFLDLKLTFAYLFGCYMARFDTKLAADCFEVFQILFDQTSVSNFNYS